MARYHLYYLKEGMLVGSDAIDADDDRDAARLAKARADGRTVEVWDSSRRVRVIAPLKADPGEIRQATGA